MTHAREWGSPLGPRKNGDNALFFWAGVHYVNKATPFVVGGGGAWWQVVLTMMRNPPLVEDDLVPPFHLGPP